MVSKALEFRRKQQWFMTNGKWESPWLSQQAAFSFLSELKEEGQVESGELLSWGQKLSWELGKLEVASIWRTEHQKRGILHNKRTPDICRGHVLKWSAEHYSAFMWGKYPIPGGKKHQKRLERTIVNAHMNGRWPARLRKALVNS